MNNLPTDEQIDDLWDYHAGYYQLYEEVRGTVHGVLKQWGIPEPTALEDGEPHHTDLDDYGSCWWWDEYDESYELLCGDMGGVAGIRKCNEMNDYPHHYTHWLPYWAIKIPKEKNDSNN